MECFIGKREWGAFLYALSLTLLTCSTLYHLKLCSDVQVFIFMFLSNFSRKIQGDFDKSFGIIQNALIPQSRHGFCDVLDSIGCWLSVCCIGVWLVPYQIYAGLIWDLLTTTKSFSYN